MENLKILVLVCLAIAGVAVLIAKLDPSNKKKPSRVPQSKKINNQFAKEDQRFETAVFGRLGPGIEKHFYTKVVGITYENEDGTIRESLLKRCKQFDFLKLKLETSNLVAVCLQGGTRLGYLNSKFGDVVASDHEDGGVWLACVKYRKLPQRRRSGCLVLCMLKMTEGWVQQNGAKCLPRLASTK